MKKLNVLLLSALTAVSASALAMGGSIEQGKNFTNLNVEMGKSTSGLYTEGSWLKNTDDGTTTGGVSIGDYVELEDIKSGVWGVTGHVTGSGTEATMFSAAV